MTADDKRTLKLAATLLNEHADRLWDSCRTLDNKWSDDPLDADVKPEHDELRKVAKRLRAIAR